MPLPGIKRWGRILAGACALAGATAPAADLLHDSTVFEHLNPRHTPIPGSLFDLNVKSVDRVVGWPAVDFYGLRTPKSLWRHLEPEHGRWDFRALDRQVDLAQAHGKEIMLLLGSAPAWAGGRPLDPGCCKPGPDAVTHTDALSMNDWRTYVSTVATHYKGRVRYYELWPDPSQSRFYNGSITQMVELGRIAYRAIKEIDPGAVVVSPGISDPAYFEKYLASGGGAAADVIGFHFVIVPRSPELMLPMISIVRSLMVKYGISQKPLWNTEASWRPGMHDRPILDTAVKPGLTDEQTQAWLVRAYILSWAAGVSRLYWTTGHHPAATPADPGKGGKVIEANGRGAKPVDASSRLPRPVDASSKTQLAGDGAGKNSRTGEAAKPVKFPDAGNWGARGIEGYNRSPKPADVAFSTVQSWLVGARMHACAMDFDKTWSCTLTRRNGHPAFIVWNAGKKTPFRLPQGWDLIQRSDIGGHTQLIRDNGQIMVDPVPVLVEKAQPE